MGDKRGTKSLARASAREHREKSGRRLPSTVWTRAKSEYIAGDESLAQLATRLGVGETAVERHADRRHRLNAGRSWGELRTDYRSQLTSQQIEATKQIEAQASVLVSMQHVTMLANLASASREVVVEAFRRCEPRDQIKMALAIIAMERRVHGLDRAPVQLEVSGRDGRAIEHDVAFEFDVDADASAVAQRTLEAIFGERAGCRSGSELPTEGGI